jgi:hypothetical protein
MFKIHGNARRNLLELFQREIAAAPIESEVKSG